MPDRARTACKPDEAPRRPTNVTRILLEENTGPPDLGVPIDADSALEQLYDEHYVRLVRLSVLLLGDAGRAEEVVQDSFVAIYQRWDRMGGADVPAYLRQTVVNRSRSVLRHLKVVAQQPTEPPPDEPGADHDLLDGVRRTGVISALARLPRRQREVLVLRYYLDLSEREIAATLRISQGAVKSHASRGAAALRRHLSPLLEEN
jgi:RNA polymerase sigma-70 factor (sigma-E family)